MRKNPDTQCFEILMVKKRHTYCFIEFVRGIYDPFKDRDLEFLFSSMTITEKAIVQSRRFDLLWDLCHNRKPSKYDQTLYARSSRKFQTLCERDGGNILTQLLCNTRNETLLWEIPKGRSGKNETAIMSAVREFGEETGLNKNAYRILFEEKTFEYSFVDCGIRYKYIYFVAMMLNPTTVPVFDCSNPYMLQEISELRFMTSAGIQELNNNRLAKLSKQIIKQVKRHISSTHP